MGGLSKDSENPSSAALPKNSCLLATVEMGPVATDGAEKKWRGGTWGPENKWP